MAYLRWISANAEALIGSARALRPPPLGEQGVALEHEPSGCCPGKDIPAFLVGWRAGAVVFLVETRGKTMTVAQAMAMASDLEERR